MDRKTIRLRVRKRERDRIHKEDAIASSIPMTNISRFMALSNNNLDVLFDSIIYIFVDIVLGFCFYCIRKRFQ